MMNEICFDFGLITLAYEGLQGDFDTLDTNTLRLLSTNDNDD